MKLCTPEQKRGISLIAVLMFMLAATTASIVVYKWVSSENFASGARLKQTEAYQAAESGVDAVHAWLSNKGADVGALVGNYFYTYGTNGTGTEKEAAPMLLTGSNNILGIVNDPSKQKFDVYLTGIDASNTNSIKFKFLSVGEGRDGSTVKLAAIFDVAGLYQVTVPGAITKKEVPVSDFDYAYFGGSIKFSGDKRFSSAVVNGKWEGNPPKVDKDFIVTGDFQTSGYGVNVGDTLCVGGVFNPDNNNNKVGAAYIGSTPYFAGDFGNVYCDGDMTIYFNNAKTKNLAINGKLSLREGSSKLVTDGNLVIGQSVNTAYIDGNNASSAPNDNDWNIVVCGNVWTNNPSGVQVSSIEKGRNIRFSTSGNDSRNYGCTVPGPSFLSFPNANRSGTGNATIYTTTGTPIGYFHSQAINDRAKDTSGWEAGSLKAYCNTKWTPTPPGHCSSAQYVVNDPIASTLGDIKAFLKDKAGGENSFDATEVINVSGNSLRCVSDQTLNIMNQGRVLNQNNGPTFVSALNQCYERLKNKPGKLYGGKYLVVKLHQEQDFGINSSSLEPLEGNFILIYSNELQFLRIAPTTTNSGVMMFLEKGVNKNTTGAEMRSLGCITGEKCRDGYKNTSNSANNTTCPYNYFIFSMGQINTINDWPATCPLYGSLYFPVNSCAGVTTANNNFGGISNPDLVQDLTEAKILCRRPDGSTYSGDCTEDEKNSSGGNNTTIVTQVDNMLDKTYWLPVSSRLKATVISKKITRETAPEANSPVLEKSVLVTPRVIRITKDAFQEEGITGQSAYEKLQNFYSLTYLNNATVLETPPLPTCAPLLSGGPEFGETNGLLPDGQVYLCSFSNNNPKYSNFYVDIGGQRGAPTVRLSPATHKLTTESCATIRLETTARGEFNDGITVNLGVFAINPSVGHRWTYNATGIGNCTITEQNEPATAWIATCPGPFTGPDIATFNICSGNESDLSVKLRINSATNINVNHQSESLIEKDYTELKIERTAFENPNNPSFVRCPSEFTIGLDWLRLTCSQGEAKSVAPNIWTCPAVTGQSVSLIPGDIPAACKIPDSYTLQTAQNSLNQKISSAIVTPGNQSVTFEFELERKSYTIDVAGPEGTSLHYLTNAMYIPEPKEGSVPRGGSFTAYHDAVYTISLGSGKFQASCSSNLACNPIPPMFLDFNKGKTGSVIATGNGTITLENIPVPSVSCPSASVGKGSTFRFGDVMPVSGYECNIANATYTFEGTPYNANTSVPSSVTANLPTGNYTVNVSYSCDNLQYTGECNFNLAGVTAQCDKPSYTVGQNAQRPSITCFYNGASRTAREAVITIGDVQVSGWNNLGANDAKPSTTLGNAGTIILRALQCGNDNPLVAIDPPIECGVVVAQQSSSSAASSSSGSSFCVQHPSPTPPDPMQKCVKAPDGKCYKCKSSRTECQNEWFWGGYGQHPWSSSWPNDGWLDEVSCSTGSNVTITSCKVELDFGNSTGGNCYNVRRSTTSITCSDGSTPEGMTFGYDGISVPAWNTTNNSLSFCNPQQRSISLITVQCGNTAITENLPFHCGYFSVSPGITCNVSTPNPCYNTGTGIPRPNVTCPSGTPGAADFYITVPNSSILSQVTDWNSPDGKYTPRNTGDNRTITLRSLECGGVIKQFPTLTCGSISVRSSCDAAPSSSSNTDYCYGVTPNVEKDKKVETTGAVCAKIQSNILYGWQASSVEGRKCRVNGGDPYSPENYVNQPGTTAESDGYVYIHCSAGGVDFKMTWW